MEKKQNIWSRLLLLIGVLGVSVYLLVPSYVYYFERSSEQREDYKGFCESLPYGLSCQKFNLGLDLMGGLHLVIGVDVERAIQRRIDGIMGSLRTRAENEEALNGVTFRRPRGQEKLLVSLNEAASSDAFEKYIRNDTALMLTAKGEDGYTFELITTERDAIRQDTVRNTVETLRKRSDRWQDLGVTDPDIRRRPDSNQIVMQMPGVDDEKYALEVIQTTAQLSFIMVDVPGSSALSSAELPEGVLLDSFAAERGTWNYLIVDEAQQDATLNALNAVLPEDRQVLFGPNSPRTGDPIEGKVFGYYLEAKPGVTGEHISNVGLQFPDTTQKIYDFGVSLDFNARGSQLFGELTGANVGRQMVIVLDDEVREAPRISERIDGSARITVGRGANAQRDARALKDVLTAGALPAPIEVLNQKKVGKTLGDYAISAGVQAVMLGGVLVVLFMLVYYRGAGLIANLALVINLVLVLAAMAASNATLTLPGIAGIVLTIGMAVDANIIIFERIREELGAGKAIRAAIDAGYSRAWKAIIDANITTFIAAIVLLQYGSGPVKGFASTLAIGIVTSMFSAIFVTRLVFDMWTSRRSVKALSI